MSDELPPNATVHNFDDVMYKQAYIKGWHRCMECEGLVWHPGNIITHEEWCSLDGRKDNDE